MWFLARVQMYVCVCARVCVCVITHKRLEISIWNLLRQWSYHNPLIVTIFMTIDAWFVILWDFEFLKKGRGSSNVRKIRAIVLKLHTNKLHPSRNFGIEFGQNRLKRSNFFRLWIFWEFFQNCLTQANFDLSSWNFVGECTNTEWCLIPNFIWIIFFFFHLSFDVVSRRATPQHPEEGGRPKTAHRGPWTPFSCSGNVKFVTIKIWYYPACARTQYN